MAWIWSAMETLKMLQRSVSSLALHQDVVCIRYLSFAAVVFVPLLTLLSNSVTRYILSSCSTPFDHFCCYSVISRTTYSLVVLMLEFHFHCHNWAEIYLIYIYKIYIYLIDIFLDSPLHLRMLSITIWISAVSCPSIKDVWLLSKLCNLHL